MLKFIFGVILIVVGFFRTFFHDPVWGLYLFALFTHIRPTQLSGEYPLPGSVPLVIAATAAMVYAVSRSYQPKFAKWPFEIWLFALMIVGFAISSANAQFVPDQSWARTFDLFKYWIFLVLFIQMIDSIHKVEWFHRVMILSSAWLVYRAWDLRGTTGPRFENVGGDVISDSNHFAAALVLLFPFVAHKLLDRDRRIAAAALVLCFGIVMAIIISGSRGGFLGLAAAVALMTFTFRGHRKKIVALILVTGLAALPFVQPGQIERLETIFAGEEGQRDSSAQLRLEYWNLAYELFKERPLTGVGLENFIYYSGEKVEGLPYGAPGHVTHSLWFEILSAGGAPVFLVFVGMILWFYGRTGRLVRRYAELGRDDMALYVQVPRVALGAFLVSATFLDRVVYEPIYWCIALGAVHGYIFQSMTKPVVAQGVEARASA